MKHTYIDEKDIGNQVICDACGDDYTGRKEVGGFLFGSKAYCPKCAAEDLPKIIAYGEELYIKARCPVGMEFRKWVLALRGGDNKIRFITTMEEKP